MAVLVSAQRKLDWVPTQLCQRIGQLGFGFAIGDRDDGSLFGKEPGNAKSPGTRAKAHHGDPFALI
jgi:hypothetical protein